MSSYVNDTIGKDETAHGSYIGVMNHHYELPIEENVSYDTPEVIESIYHEPNDVYSKVQKQSKIHDKTETDITDESKSRKYGMLKNLKRNALTIVLIVFVILSLVASIICIVLYAQLRGELDDLKNVERFEKSGDWKFEANVTNDSKATEKLIQDLKVDLLSQISKYQNDSLEKMHRTFKIYNWYQADNSRWYKLFETKVKYSQARVNCEALGARLASTGIRSPKTKTVLVEKLVNPIRSHTWIGLDDLQEHFNWTWSDGVRSNEKNTKWRRGQPDNESVNERCAHLSIGKNWVISHKECGRQFFYLCESA